MKRYQEKELKEFLQSLGVRAKKSLSQNFLIDGNVIMNIIKAADIQKDDFVLEIGPGPGALTEALLETGCRVLAVEKDRTFAKALQENSHDSFEVFCADIMEFPIVEEIRKRLSKGKKAKVVSNLPYSLTTPILEKLAPLHEWISSLHLMVQKEVAERICANTNTKQYGSLSLFLAYYSDAHYDFTISRNCFMPKPNVDSAIISLNLHPPLLGSNQKLEEEGFFRLTRTAFSQRRKMLRASLKKLYPSEAVEKALIHIEMLNTARPENLSVHKFIELYRTLST